MVLKFIHNFRVLEIVSVTEVELKQLETITTAHGYNWQTQEKWTKCYMQQNRYIPGGFWKEIMMLTKAKRPWKVQITNLNEMLYDISQTEFEAWLDEQPFKFVPKWYQAKGAYLALKYRYSKGQFATSAGKSFIQYIVARYLLEKRITAGKKVLMIVPSVMLVKQMAADVGDYATDEFVTCDQIFGGSKRNKSANLVISTIDSLANRELEFFEQFEAILVDEAHKLTTKTYQQVINWVPYKQIKLIYAVSGTFHDKLTNEGMIQTQYAGPTLIDVTAKQLMDEGSITPVKIKVLNLRYGFETSKAYYHAEGIDIQNKRNHAEMKFIRMLPDRFNKISNTVAKLQNNQLLLFKSVEYCEAFARYLEERAPDKEVFVIHGDVSADRREYIRLRTEEIDNAVICATYPTMSTGVSIKRLVWMHLIESSKSFIRIRQSIGRTLRLHPDKDYAHILDYVDIFKKHRRENKETGEPGWPGPHQNVSARHGKARQKIYKEQEFEYTVTNIDL